MEDPVNTININATTKLRVEALILQKENHFVSLQHLK